MNQKIPVDLPRNPRASLEFPRRRWPARWLFSGAVIATILGVSLLLPALLPVPPRPPTSLGSAPDFVLRTDRGGTMSLSQFAGRIVVIHFVILVCCAKSALEIGYMKQVEPTFRDRGVVFVSIAINSTDNFYTPQKYRELMGFDWTLGIDLNGDVQRLYGATETSTLVIAHDGTIRYRDDETTSPGTLSAWLQGVI